LRFTIDAIAMPNVKCHGFVKYLFSDGTGHPIFAS